MRRNTKADISLKPAKTNKALHDTYLRMGELKAEGQGQNVYESFDNAAENMGKKLHKWRKASPQRKDMRNIGQSYRPSSNPGSRQGR
jgi:ribosome-associated translation inhibitor RaiA